MRCWLAVTAERPQDADAVALTADGTWLAAWRLARKPRRGALRIDPAAVDPGGPPLTVSLSWAPEGFLLPVDDLAVQEARRAVLRGPAPACVSLLLADASHLAGSLIAWRPGQTGDDPFARLLPARRLVLGPGLLAVRAPPAGPVIERYGSDRPWPADRFEEA